MSFPRVLLIAMSRINAADPANNGLLLRNLFGSWPRGHLAQIYSSGDNGDDGFFSRYYRLSPQDRRLGGVFYKLKAEAYTVSAKGTELAGYFAPRSMSFSIKSLLRRYLVDSGLYELIFRVRLSREMLRWVMDFEPDVIFAQGYNLTFTWLPVMLAKETGIRTAFLTTDDWPTYLYSGRLGEAKTFTRLLRPVVRKAVRRLMETVDIPFAFGQPMAEEYSSRYRKRFITLSHADNPERFRGAAPYRIHPPGVRTILAAGYFNKYRWPLLLDADVCCRQLNEQGVSARIAVFSAGMDPEGARALAGASCIDILDDPGNDLLPGYLKGADILILAEGFDEGWVSAIRLSVSSKSHLFMLSRRPIIVYAHPNTGVSKYAAAYRWGRVVTERNVSALFAAISELMFDADAANQLILCADETAKAFHLREASQEFFLKSLSLGLS